MYCRTSIKIYKYIYLGTFSRLSGLRLTYLKRNLGPLSDWFKFGRNNIYILIVSIVLARRVYWRHSNILKMYKHNNIIPVCYFFSYRCPPTYLMLTIDFIFVNNFKHLTYLPT